MEITSAITNGDVNSTPNGKVVDWAATMEVELTLKAVIHSVDQEPRIKQSMCRMNSVLVELRNAPWQLLHAEKLVEAIVASVGRGGEANTNAAICGAMPGSVYGTDAVTQLWFHAVLICRPNADRPRVRQPRTAVIWQVGTLQLTDRLLAV